MPEEGREGPLECRKEKKEGTGKFSSCSRHTLEAAIEGEKKRKPDSGKGGASHPQRTGASFSQSPGTTNVEEIWKGIDMSTETENGTLLERASENQEGAAGGRGGIRDIKNSR